ncbi:helix-turn-helix domain-containing protein [Brevibacillus laterosporus]|uniref:helix-turn-helix domain-containing protein n=1 Tax=Brevibacillus laterosporus TaxID=1465 RepID=UPI00345554DD
MYGARIGQLRKELKMTQKELSEKLNKAKSIISQYENKINEPDLATLTQMCIIFCFYRLYFWKISRSIRTQR